MKDLLIEDLCVEVAPGGCAEPVLHVPAVIAVIVILIPTPAF